MVGFWHIPSWQSFVRRGNASIERHVRLVGLVSRLGALLLHALDGVELVIDGRSLGDGLGLLGAKECGRRSRT